jgi:hypothetical protein
MTAVTEEYLKGQAAGAFTTAPIGVILHGSRGGAADTATEYRGTVNWAAGNPDGLGWNATIGEQVFCVHLPATLWGWNARGDSSRYLAVEFAQPALSDPITDGMVAAFCAWFLAEVIPAWPALWPPALELPMHSELATGAADGKTDAYLASSAEADDLRARILAGLTGAAAGGPPFATADEAFDDYLRREGETALWAGQVTGRGHWFGRDPQELVRTDADALLAYDGGAARDATALALDDWESVAKAGGQLVVWGEGPPPEPEPPPVASAT